MQILISNAVVSSKVKCTEAANQLLEFLQQLRIEPASDQPSGNQPLPFAASTLLDLSLWFYPDAVVLIKPTSINRALVGR
jgi:hypothetical protein